MILRWELPPVESWKLKDHWSQLWTENVHGFQEFFKFRIAVQQNFFMRDALGNLDRKYKALGSAGGPIANGARSRTGIERRINFDGMKVICVEGEVIGGSHSFRIERSLPARRHEGRGSQKDRRKVHAESIPKDEVVGGCATTTLIDLLD